MCETVESFIESFDWIVNTMCRIVRNYFNNRKRRRKKIRWINGNGDKTTAAPINLLDKWFSRNIKNVSELISFLFVALSRDRMNRLIEWMRISIKIQTPSGVNRNRIVIFPLIFFVCGGRESRQEHINEDKNPMHTNSIQVEHPHCLTDTMSIVIRNVIRSTLSNQVEMFDCFLLLYQIAKIYLIQ